MKKLIIADIRGNVINGRISGHIVPVARNYKEALSEWYDVKIAAGPALLNSFDREECIVLPYNINSESKKDKMKTFVNFIVLLWKAKGTPIIFQQSTTLTTLISIIFFYWWTSRIYMIQYNTDALNSTLKRFINRIAQLKNSGTICPSDRIGQAYGGKYCVIPDYLYTKKESVQIPFSQRIWDICIVGGITANKGVIEAAQYLAGKPYKVIIAGRICEEGLEEPLREIVSKCENIELRLGFVSDKEYVEYIRKSRYCMLNYRGTYFDRSSGVVLDAIYNGTSVLGTRCEALKTIEKHGLGFVYDDISELAQYHANYDDIIEKLSSYLFRQRSKIDKLRDFIS